MDTNSNGWVFEDTDGRTWGWSDTAYTNHAPDQYATRPFATERTARLHAARIPFNGTVRLWKATDQVPAMH